MHRYIMGSTKRTTIRLSDERQLLLERAKEIVASGPHDDPPTADVIDAALTHLVDSKENVEAVRSELSPETIQKFDTSVLGFHYRTAIESRWR
jgi:hypothetical protein